MQTEKITIEKNIPIPALRTSGRTDWQVVIARANPGDSILLSNARASYLCTLGRKQGWRMTYRAASEDQMRVWFVGRENN